MDTRPKFFVFVLMPFADKYADLYELGIKAVCKEADAYCERIDETFFQEGIMDRIYNQIARADAIVALMNDRNPNVFYEVGYAHALGKRVGLLTSTAEDIPFDLKHYPAIVYGDRITDLKSRLRGWIDWCIAHPSDSLVRADVPVRVLFDGAEVGPDQVIKLCREPGQTSTLRLDFAIHNPTTLLYPKGSFQIGIVAPGSFQTCASTTEREAAWTMEYHYSAMGGEPTPTAVPHTEYPKAERFPLADGKALFVLGWWAEVLFPAGWAAISCNMKRAHGDDLRIGQVYDFCVRLFTELGSKDFPFKVEITRPGPK